MRLFSKITKAQRGGALIYFAIILILGSLVAITIAKYHSPERNISQNQQLDQKMAVISKALNTFVAKNGRLPCPASPGLSIGNANFGVESRDTNFECNASGLIANTAVGSIKYMGRCQQML